MAVQMYACYLTLAHIACIATQTDILVFTSHSFFISKAWVLQDLLENSCRSKEQKNVCFQTGHGMHVFETRQHQGCIRGSGSKISAQHGILAQILLFVCS